MPFNKIAFVGRVSEKNLLHEEFHGLIYMCRHYV